jgi:hypothetical protein
MEVALIGDPGQETDGLSGPQPRKGGEQQEVTFSMVSMKADDPNPYVYKRRL